MLFENDRQGSPTVILIDDSESARSPSPPGPSIPLVLTKRREPALLNPRVIPTERSEKLSTNWGNSTVKTNDFNHGQTKPTPSFESLYERRRPASGDKNSVASSAANKPKDWTETYERRPATQVKVLQDSDMRGLLPLSNKSDWKETGDTDARKFEMPVKMQDQDMRIPSADQSVSFNKFHPTIESVESSLNSDKQHPATPSNGNELNSSLNLLGFPSNMMNPLNPAHLHPPGQNPFGTQPMLNPFLNPSVMASMSGMTGMTPQQLLSIQSQANLMYGFQSQQISNPRPGPGLLPTPGVPNNMNSNFGFQRSNAIVQNRVPTQTQQSQASTLEPRLTTAPTNAESDQMMMSRIQEKAAESFQRGRGPVPRYPHSQTQPQVGRDRAHNMTVQGYPHPNSNEFSNDFSVPPAFPVSNPTNSMQNNSNAILDPRLKPRLRREPIQLPVVEPKLPDNVPEPTPTPIKETGTEPKSKNPSAPTVPSRIHNTREGLRRSLEEKPSSTTDEQKTETSTRSHPQRKTSETRQKSPEKETRSRTRSELPRNNSPASDRSKSGFLKDRSQTDKERLTDAEERNNKTWKRNPRKGGDKKDKWNSPKDRNPQKSHPSVLPFETSVFRNSSEPGRGATKFRLPKIKKPEPPPPEPEPDPISEPEAEPDVDTESVELEISDYHEESDEVSIQ